MAELDITRYAGQLDNYQATLDATHRAVSEAHRDLEAAYRALREVYGGQGADEFDAAWRAAGTAIFAYTDGAPRLIQLLEGKVEQLRALDRGL
jgi:hypothetical protein